MHECTNKLLNIDSHLGGIDNFTFPEANLHCIQSKIQDWISYPFMSFHLINADLALCKSMIVIMPL